MKNKTMYRPISDEKNAVVGIVTAILIVGLLVTVFSIVQTVYVPEWMEEIEKDHLDTISAQFAELKHTIDIQLYTTSKKHIPVTTPITLGSGNVPFFLSQKSSGSITINNDQFEIEIDGDNQYQFPLGTISYQSQNSYFTNQRYVFEAGAVILNQSEGTLLKSPPFFSVNNSVDITIRFTLVNITSTGGKTSTYGSSTCGILTNYSDEQTFTISNVSSMIITTPHQNPWYQYIDDECKENGLTSTHYTLTENNNGVEIDFNSGSSPKTVTVILTHVKINTQIAPGWIG